MAAPTFIYGQYTGTPSTITGQFTIPPVRGGQTFGYRRKAPRVMKGAAEVLSRCEFPGTAEMCSWVSTTTNFTRLAPLKLIYNTVSSPSQPDFPGYYSVGGFTASDHVSIQDFPGNAGRTLSLSSRASYQLADPDPPDDLIPSEPILDRLGKYVAGHMATSQSIFRNTSLNPITQVGLNALNNLAFIPGAIAHVLLSLFENLTAGETDDKLLKTAKTLVLWCPQLDSSAGEFPPNEPFIGDFNPRRKDVSVLRHVQAVLQDLFALLDMTDQITSVKWKNAVAFLKFVSDLADVFANFAEIVRDDGFDVDWDGVTDYNEINAALTDAKAFIAAMALMIQSVIRAEDRSDDPFYHNDMSIARILFEKESAAGGSSGWTEELINKVFISPDVGEPYFKFSGGAIQAPWTMPE